MWGRRCTLPRERARSGAEGLGPAYDPRALGAADLETHEPFPSNLQIQMKISESVLSESGRVLDYHGKENRRMCSLFLSLMDKFDIRLERFGDSDERLAEV